MQELIINKETAGGRADKTIMKYLNKAPSGFVYKMLRKKNIVINDKKAKGDEILSEGDSVKLYLSDETIDKFKGTVKPQSERKAVNKKQEDPSAKYSGLFKNMIVYEDENLIAVNKPSGILSQKSVPTDYSVNDMLVAYLGKTELFTPGISNRLDRNTSGLMIAGKNPNAVRCLNNAIRERKIKKYYICAVIGKITEDKLIDGYLVKDEKNNKVRIYKELPSDINEADRVSHIRTAYSVLSANDSVTLLSVDLITGKSHQIRAHLASEGHPVIGDTKYGLASDNIRYKNLYHISDQQLHSYRLVFENMDGILEYMNGKTITCALTPELSRLIKGEKLCLHGHQEG